jgi:hypothetical protein
MYSADADTLFAGPRVHWGWGLLVTVLLLLLAAQLVHHNRKTLVADPRLEQPMRALYGLFGVTLEPTCRPMTCASWAPRRWAAPLPSCCAPRCRTWRRIRSRHR